MFDVFLLRSIGRPTSRCRSGSTISTAIGNTGRAYVTLPARGKGLGQVQVSVSGRLKTMPAASNGKEIAAFSDVKVVEARDDGTLIVEPLE